MHFTVAYTLSITKDSQFHLKLLDTKATMHFSWNQLREFRCSDSLYIIGIINIFKNLLAICMLHLHYGPSALTETPFSWC